jgi:hypothetical protein
MKVGDLITHRPSEAVGIVIEETKSSICVVWCSDPLDGREGEKEWISKVFVENLKGDKKCPTTPLPTAL